ncbi:MAG TPA: Gfo/Idh/MocA family oxidoreductase [Opitutaceae bacterium]|nr:Gfo/Idh/MocA family oxidoreductase [Opitutaceae bacterium]
MAAPSAPLPRYAIVGCGLIGRKRAAGLRPGQLRYACDLDAARAEALAAATPGCRAVTDVQAALRDPAVTIVVVATLNAGLAPITQAALAAGKHVLVEKPGALSAAQLRAVEEIRARSGTRVRIGYNHRYHPALQQARALVDSGATGPLMFLRGRYGHGGRKGYDREWRADPALSGGGELIDQGVHLIDLASWFLGDFATVEGHAATYYWDMEVDDNAFLSLRTAAGQTAWLHVSCTEWKNLFSLEIYGRDGKIAVDGLGGSYGVERCTWHRMLPQMGPPETTVWDYPQSDGSWAAELAAFESEILDNPPNPGLVRDIRILEIVETIYRASGYAVDSTGSQPPSHHP